MGDAEKIRLFVAVSLPHDLLAALDEALAPLRAKLVNARWAPVENQHLTLKFLGWAPSELLEPLSQTLRMVASGHEAEEISLTELGAFPSERRVRVMWMGVDDQTNVLARLASDLDRALEPLGFPTEARSYTPHLTVARFRLPVPLKSGFPQLTAPPHDPVRVASIELYRSHLSPKGARYEVVESFRLGSKR